MRVSFERIYYTFAEKPDKIFGQDWRERLFSFVGNWLEHMEGREILCIHRPEILTVSVGPGYKTSRECIQSFYNDVIDRLIVATSQPKNDHSELMLRLDTNQPALIGVPIVH